jgi:dihydrofolate synthase / folylpolyglutamate synthase
VGPSFVLSQEALRAIVAGMLVRTIQTRIFNECENLADFISEHLPRLAEGSVLVVTSKIVALSEGRTRNMVGIKNRERIIKEESSLAIRTKYTWLTIKDGMVMSSAGIDESNANGKLILLPKDSFIVAAKLRNALRKTYTLKKLGVLITDSRLFPLRAGIVGVALGYAGFKGVKDYRGNKDIFGRVLKYSRVDVADSLATAAVLEMGEGAEQQPLAVIENAAVEFCERVNRKELVIDLEEDVYLPLFARISRKNSKA